MKDRLHGGFTSWLHAVLMLVVALASFAVVAADPVPGVEDGAGVDTYCGGCHGVTSSVGTLAPDLLQLARERKPLDIVRVLLHGKFDRGGTELGHLIPVMPQLDYLSNAEIAGIVNRLFEQVESERLAAGRPVMPLSPQQVEMQRFLSSPAESPGALDAADYERASDLYFEHCSGCHGVTREGGGGGALYIWQLAMRGSSGVTRILHKGSSVGMPAWGDRSELSDADMSLLAQFLLLPAPPAPVFTINQVHESWQELVAVAERPRRRRFPVRARDLFVAMLHDRGEVLLIDGRSQEVVAKVPVDLAPHDVEVSADGRYLYVISRGAQVSLIDLFMEQPAVVAKVRVALEGRSLSLGESRRDPLLVVGGYWPPHYAVLEAETLRPLAVELVDRQAYRLGQTAAEISQVVATDSPNRFALVTKAEGSIRELNLDVMGEALPGNSSVEEAPPYLRAGSFDLSGRYLMLPADGGKVVVYDTEQGAAVKTIEVPHLHGGARGVAHLDKDYGPVWTTGSLVGDSLAVIATGPSRNDDLAWQVVRELPLPGGGSLNVATHPASSNLWLDIPLNADPQISEYGYVLDLQAPETAVQKIPVAHWAGLTGQGVRVLHPQYDRSGKTVWFTVWNEHDKKSAIVVVDDKTRALKKVIHDDSLVSPIRTYGLGTRLVSKRRRR